MTSQLNIAAFNRDANGSISVKIDGESAVEIPVLTADVLTVNSSGTHTGPLTVPNASGAPTVDWVDASGTPAATATCSSVAGRVALDATRTTLVVTNTKVGVGAMVLLQKLDLDGTATDFKCEVNALGGEFTITSNAAATADVLFDFLVVNVNDVTPA